MELYLTYLNFKLELYLTYLNFKLELYLTYLNFNLLNIPTLSTVHSVFMY